MTEFLEALKQRQNDIDLLPVFHNSDAYSFRSILKGRTIELNLCSVLKKDLTYVFYGKPSYRKQLGNSTSNYSKFPICFILNTENLPTPYKVYPFDSGLFSLNSEFRTKYFHPRMKLDDFEISKDTGTLKNFISTYFGNNKSYLHNNVNMIDGFGNNYEALSYYNLIQAKEDDFFDDRVSTIEICYDSPIPLNVKTVNNIVCPSSFLDDKEIKSIIENELKISYPITYYSYRCNPLELHGIIREKAYNYLHKIGA